MSIPFWLMPVVGAMPHGVRQELRRLQYRWQLRCGRFRSPEHEYGHLSEMLRPGDWAVDVGANVGHYASRMSELVGSTGRVIALEPAPPTFEILAANSRFFAHQNVTLVNAAAGDQAGVRGMAVPDWGFGVPNYYRAHLTEYGAIFRVACLRIDSLDIPHRVVLMKIDVEGALTEVLRGANRLIERDRPILIVEADAAEVAAISFLRAYSAWRYPGSPNVLLAADWAPAWTGMRPDEGFRTAGQTRVAASATWAGGGVQ
jgi:FkbM family methyltransferase